MEQFVRQNRVLLLSVAWLVIGLLALGHAALTSHRVAVRAHVDAASTWLRSRNDGLRQRLNRRGEATDQPRLSSLPDFLSHINAIARASEVIVEELRPAADGDLRFDMRISVDYYNFLSFAANLEAHSVAIHDLEVRPFDFTRTPPIHVITFALTPRNDAAPIVGARIDALRRAVAANGLRNPFQRFVVCGTVVPEIDLTWRYQLSGIGRDGAGPVATVDRRDYRVGDRLDDMNVVAIEPDRVRLQRDGARGLETLVLRFRRDPGAN